MDSASPQPAAHRPIAESGYPHAIALSIQVGRNLMLQGLALGMVSLMGLTVAPWPVVLAWTVLAVAAVAVEHRLLRHIVDGGAVAGTANRWAPGLRVCTTTVYATAVLALMLLGGPGQRLFACALISASLVHVLMRYYRSPRILVASIAPYVVVLAVVGSVFARKSLAAGQPIAAAAPLLALVLFGLQFWSAREQLAGAWGELMRARRAAEDRERAAEAANRAKSQFLATMSHELRTPLHGVLGMAQALTDNALSREQRQRVAVIQRSSETLLGVLNDLLDLSKIEAHAFELEVVEFDLEHLVRGVCAAYLPQADRKGLSFRFDISAGAQGRYLGDSARLRRILYGLADNAVKFTEAGGVTLEVDREGETLVFRIVDTGIGIAPENLTRLFEGFFQADAGLSRRYGGLGIGLAICSQLASLMNGRISAESELGRGTAFTLRLPLRRARAAPATAPHATSLAEADRGPRLRVLAAEDNPTNQLILRTFLASAGLEPVIVANGREAVAAWEAGEWDIVLMDIQMPEMDGVEAARAIRARERETGRRRTPIVAVTANAMTHQLGEYAAAGLDQVVSKPVDAAGLFTAMDAALAGSGREAAAA